MYNLVNQPAGFLQRNEVNGQIHQIRVSYGCDQFSEYWFETGTPTFLVKLLKRTDYDIRRIADADVEIDIDMISGVNDYINDPIPVLYQSGYLTIRSFDEMFGIYRLGFPNMEVRKGYARPFAADSRKLFRIGVSFSKENRRIEDWKILDSEA